MTRSSVAVCYDRTQVLETRSAWRRRNIDCSGTVAGVRAVHCGAWEDNSRGAVVTNPCTQRSNWFRGTDGQAPPHPSVLQVMLPCFPSRLMTLVSLASHLIVVARRRNGQTEHPASCTVRMNIIAMVPPRLAPRLLPA